MKSLIERWDELAYSKISYECIRDYDYYVQLFKRELHPSMFIPWDKENNCPLEKPTPYSDVTGFDSALSKSKFNHKSKAKQYQQAESEVIFEGFEVIDYNGTKSIAKFLFMKDYDDRPMYYHIYWLKDGQWVISNGIKTIEDIHKHVELNSNGKKLGGLI